MPGIAPSVMSGLITFLKSTSVIWEKKRKKEIHTIYVNFCMIKYESVVIVILLLHSIKQQISLLISQIIKIIIEISSFN